MKRLALIVTCTLLLAGCGLFEAPKIPHKITDEMDCKSCHATGANGAPVSPHPNKPNCLSCHKAK